MNILIAPDSFKDALDAANVAEHISKGLKMADPKFEIELLPMADGGEGSAKLVCEIAGGEWVDGKTFDALLRPITAGFAWFQKKNLAIVELAEASGLQGLIGAARNPMRTSTFGTGVQIKQAIERGAKEVLITLGGSATQDSGTGMAAALGFRFYSGNEEIAKPSGGDLEEITRILPPTSDLLRDVKITALCDVDNPLLGDRGTAAVYAPQKGAIAKMVKALERGNQNLSDRVSTFLKGKEWHKIPGSGAAGGAGFGAMAFLGAALKPGAPEMMSLLHFEEKLARADWLITGEGRIDNQTVHGKLLAAQGKLAAKHGVPVIALCGQADITPESMQSIGLTAVFPLGNGARTLTESLRSTGDDLVRMGYQVGRIICKSQT
ncbi:MAG: glycerate kinase [Flavobacteriales bacterium]|nr:glycerate kinase [Flavobacteriales bacterium]